MRPEFLNFVNVSGKHKNRDLSTDIAECEMLVMTVQGLRYTFLASLIDCSRQKMCKILREAQWQEYFHYVLHIFYCKMLATLWRLWISKSTKYLHNPGPIDVVSLVIWNSSCPNSSRNIFLSLKKNYFFVLSHFWGQIKSYVGLVTYMTMIQIRKCF